MEIIVCKLDDVKWVVIGEKVLVDRRYLAEYAKSRKKKGLGCKHKIACFAKVALCLYCVGVLVHIYKAYS